MEDNIVLNAEKICTGSLGANCYIVTDEKNMVVVDPGDNGETIIEQIERIGLKPSAILLTHAHADHIGAATQIRDKYNCKIYIGEEDLPLLTDTERNLANYLGSEGNVYVINDAIPLKSGDLLDFGDMRVEVYETKGHTAGGLTYKIGNMLFSGDTLFGSNIGRTDLYSGSYEEIMESIAFLANSFRGCEVLCGHGDSTTIDEEIKNNPYVRQSLGL